MTRAEESDFPLDPLARRLAVAMHDELWALVLIATARAGPLLDGGQCHLLAAELRNLVAEEMAKLLRYHGWTPD